MQLQIGYLPAGQKVTAWVTYPNGSQVALGDRFMAVGGDGNTYATWNWTVPAGMTLGNGQLAWHVPCTGGRNMDGTYPFTVQ
jgi:hypothetical protein